MILQSFFAWINQQEGDVPIELTCNSGIELISRWPLLAIFSVLATRVSRVLDNCDRCSFQGAFTPPSGIWLSSTIATDAHFSVPFSTASFVSGHALIDEHCMLVKKGAGLEVVPRKEEIID